MLFQIFFFRARHELCRSTVVDAALAHFRHGVIAASERSFTCPSCDQVARNKDYTVACCELERTRVTVTTAFFSSKSPSVTLTSLTCNTPGVRHRMWRECTSSQSADGEKVVRAVIVQGLGYKFVRPSAAVLATCAEIYLID